MDTLRMAAVLGALGPLLREQGLAARRGRPVLPVCPDAHGLLPGQGPPLRLLLVGDSIIAGVGAPDQERALSGRLAWHLARGTGRPVEWRTLGRNGARARDLLALDAPTDSSPDLLVVSVGVNDSLNFTSRNAFRRQLAALAARWPVPVKILAGIPNLGEFPALDRPLRNVLGWRSRTLAEAVPEPWRTFRFGRPLLPEEFSPDNFHPGPAGCDAWAEDLARFIQESTPALRTSLPRWNSPR